MRFLTSNFDDFQILSDYIFMVFTNLICFRGEVSLCVDILSVCVEALDSDNLFLAFHTSLSLGLKSSNHHVCLLSIKMVIAFKLFS